MLGIRSFPFGEQKAYFQVLLYIYMLVSGSVTQELWHPPFFHPENSAWWKFEDVSSEPLFFPLRSEGLRSGTLPKTNHDNGKSTMNEDVSPIEHGDFPACHVSFQGCNS